MDKRGESPAFFGQAGSLGARGGSKLENLPVKPKPTKKDIFGVPDEIAEKAVKEALKYHHPAQTFYGGGNPPERSNNLIPLTGPDAQKVAEITRQILSLEQSNRNKFIREKRLAKLKQEYYNITGAEYV